MRSVSNEHGSVSLEVAIIAPALLLVLSVVIMGGRIMVASNGAEAASGSAARAASLARSPGEASVAAQRAATSDLAGQGLSCAGSGPEISTDTSNWAGRPGSVTVRITCEIELSDLVVPGLPGSRTVAATATSPVDTWRSP
ncbi:pilus assembly protein [Janibacter melonis]|uniref:TadE/TadG family type IV pilus assembly protein n=1 Tax=Janibacter melonis TaxID=262209 RepID=UPI002559C341|nr:TadE/TadG family type IV pilus assembly protein [Janibacter melonis]MCM3555914.1 pilus assembly protein [Janibacter melonis]